MHAPTHAHMSAAEWLMLVILSVLWGGSFFFVKIALVEVPPLSLVLARVALAAIALAVFLAATGRDVPTAAPFWRACFGMGLLNNLVPFSLFAWGQTEIASGLAAILNATTPLFTVLVAHVLTSEEKITRLKLAGVAVGLGGVIAMIGPGAVAGIDRALLAEIACLTAAVFYAFSGVYGRRFRHLGVSPAQTAFGQLTASSIMMLPLVALVDRPWTLLWPSSTSLAAIVALALISTALAYVIFYRILASAGATNIMLVTFLIPVSAIMLGAVVLGERLQWSHFAGMGLIAAGLLLIDGRFVARLAVFGPSAAPR